MNEAGSDGLGDLGPGGGSELAVTVRIVHVVTANMPFRGKLDPISVAHVKAQNFSVIARYLRALRQIRKFHLTP